MNEKIFLKTKFRFRAFLPLILATIFLFLLLGMACNLIDGGFNKNLGWVKYLFLFYFWLVLIWLVFGELRNKFIVVHFSKYKISVSKLGGLLGTKSFKYEEIDFWKNSKLGNYLGSSEFIYLYSNGKKIAKFRNFIIQIIRL